MTANTVNTSDELYIVVIVVTHFVEITSNIVAASILTFLIRKWNIVNIHFPLYFNTITHCGIWQGEHGFSF